MRPSPAGPHDAANPGEGLRSIVMPGSTAQRLLLGCGLIGPVLFTVTYLIEGITRPGYDGWRQPISALSLGPGGWVQQANFVVFGLLVGCFAIALRAALVPGVGATRAPILQGVTALGLIVAGLFSQDPALGYPPGTLAPATPTPHAVLHLAGTIISLTARVGWCFVMARRFAQEPHWRGWATYAIATGILEIVFLSAFGQAMGNNGPAGLFERLAIIVTSLLTVALAARLSAGTGRVSPNG
jgi:hypothetical protein